jgi:hypothetical protein
MTPSTCPAKLNYLINHTEIRPYLGYGDTYLDAEPFLNKEGTIFLTVQGGGLLFLRKSQTVYTVDVYYLPPLRGAKARQVTKDAFDYLFFTVGAERLECQALSSNARSRHFIGSLGFKRTGQKDEQFIRYELERETWQKLQQQ